MKLLLLLPLACIMAAAMTAQTINGVTIGGTTEKPEVINNSSRTIIGYVLHFEDDSQMPTNIPVYRMAGIAPGTKDVFVRVDDFNVAAAAGRQAMARDVHRDGAPVVGARISLDSVIFGDGEFSGPDVAQFFKFAVAHIDAIREFASQSLSDMTRVEAAVNASRNASLQARIYRRGKTGEQLIATHAEDDLASELFSIQQVSGIEAARKEAYRLSKLPALWKGETK